MGDHGEGFMFPPEFPSAATWPVSAADSVKPAANTSSFSSLAAPAPTVYRTMYSSAMQFSDISGRSAADALGLGGLYTSPSPSSRFGSSIHSELISTMTVQEVLDAKAIAASKSHSEAERRRRGRINMHLAKLRSLLPSTTKTDKASLLAEVIQHVKELKRQTSTMSEKSPVPTEVDELTLDTCNENGKLIIKASLCCDDRSNLISELVKALKSLKLQILKAEITTLSGRVKTILVVTSEDDSSSQHQQSVVSSIQEALREVMERNAAVADTSTQSTGGIKRQRTNNLSTIVQQWSY